jgi:signal transduction histidine kinase
MECDDTVQDFEMQLRTLEGKVIWVRHNSRAIRDRNGKILYYEGAIEDITERKQVEEDRKALLAREQAARAQAEAASRMKDEFLATLSHELRTPLNAIQGWANLLRSRKLDEATTARALETIERNAKIQTQMVEDLLDISRIIRGKLRLTFHPVNLVSVLNEAIDVVRPAASAKNIALESLLDPACESEKVKGERLKDESLAPDRYSVGTLSSPLPLNLPPASSHQPPATSHLPLMVLGDTNRLQQVFWNLLANAIKFTPSGGQVEVRLSVVSENALDGRGHVRGFSLPTTYHLPPTAYAQIQVIDTGQGISPDFLPHIFEYFRQADSTSTRSHGGIGLGLAIVHQLVELHGGTVYADSPGNGQGATFTVQLPLLEDSRGAEGQRGRGEITSHPTPYSPHSSLAGVRVLVVDDELDSREFLILALEQYGAKVVAASSAAEAKSVIVRVEPDVLISDIAMPEEDGYELMRQLRSQGKQIPAIALTAYARDSDRNAAIAAGFQQHVSKPIAPEELVTLVADLVSKKQ